MDLFSGKSEKISMIFKWQGPRTKNLPWIFWTIEFELITQDHPLTLCEDWRIIIVNLLISAGLNNYNHPAHHLRGVTSNNSMTIMNGRPNHHQTRYERMNHKPLIVGPDLLASWRLCPIWLNSSIFFGCCCCSTSHHTQSVTKLWN